MQKAIRQSPDEEWEMMLRYFRGSPLWLKLIGIAGVLLWLAMLANSLAMLFNPGAPASARFPLPVSATLILMGAALFANGVFLWFAPQHQSQPLPQNARIERTLLLGIKSMYIGVIIAAPGLLLLVSASLRALNIWISLILTIIVFMAGAALVTMITDHGANRDMPPSSRL